MLGYAPKMVIRAGLFVCTVLLPLLVPDSVAEEQSPSARTHFDFHQPRAAGYLVQRPAAGTNSRHYTAGLPTERIKAWPDNGSTNYVEFGSRLVLQVKTPEDLSAVLQGRLSRVARSITDTLFILEAPDLWTGLDEAQSLSKDERVLAAYPVVHRRIQLYDQYAPRPNDPFFFQPGQSADEWQANLENRDTNGTPLGVDLNVRAAWSISQGEGTLVAVADDGIELDHPDLIDRITNAPHYNFVTGQTNGMPSGSFSFHATAVAGLAAATANNHIGIAGVAPKARLASWVIWDANENLVSEEVLMDMFQYQSNVVSVQNHSWGKVGAEQLPISSLEDVAISNAVMFGRSGRGVVLVRAAGNGRLSENDVNEDGYAADPRVISVAAVRLDGHVARFSSPGACILVAAPSGDVSADPDPCLSNSPNLVTTDRQGQTGYASGDYTFGPDSPFSGTSASTPQIAGLVALILAVNTNLTYRDVQQILIHSSRHYDLADPSLVTNAAGFRVSHNLGFGVPDAGMAVRLAQRWPNRPAATVVQYVATNSMPIPDLGLRVLLQGTGLPASLGSIAARPGDGPHPAPTTPVLPLVDVGLATNAITADLRGKAALIERGANYFCQKISFAAQAGAEFVIVYNNQNGDVLMPMYATQLTPIPAVAISQNDGEALRSFLAAQPDVQAQLHLDAVHYHFSVQETLLCEFVSVRLETDHTARGDLRVVLTSPSGTQSVLQHVNQDTLPGPVDWTYYSVQHFYESSFGDWTLEVADEDTAGTGSVKRATLTIRGVPITDSDHDGLDASWELKHFHTLAYGPQDDPDHDGYINSREQIMGTDPNASDSPFLLDLSVWDDRLARLSWQSDTNTTYQIQIGPETVVPLVLTTNLTGRFRETEWFVPYTSPLHQFFRVEAVPKGR